MTTIYPANQGPTDKGQGKPKETLLERINKRFDCMVKSSKDIRDEAERNQRALSVSGPWADEDRDERKRNGRPCIHLDQLTQYINALVNEVRSNPIGIKIQQGGEGSSKETAELRSNRIRAIEYESNAIQAYATAFESAASMSFGVAGVMIDYKSWDSFQKVIKIRRIANPWAFFWDPDTKEADASDMKDCFLLDRVQRDDFVRKYPNATITSFGPEQAQFAPLFFDQDDAVQVGEYWYIDYKARRKFRVKDSGGNKQEFWADELEGYKASKTTLTLKDGTQFAIVDERKTQEPIIKRCLTNGVEVWDEEEWPGKWIGFAVCLGKEKYVRQGNRVKRQLDSYITMARDAQMLFDYAKTNETEMLGQSPKNLRLGYKGQFDTNTDWEHINKTPTPFAEVNGVTDATGDILLPLPRFDTYQPPIQATEISAESARRAIQAAVASYGVTRLDDTNVKSGVALERLKQNTDLGSFHFIDNYKTFIRHIGRMVNDLLDNVESGDPQDVAVITPDEKQSVVRINEPDQDGKTLAYSLSDEAQHEVTVSTGPNFQSQQEEGKQTVDTLVANLDKLPLDPPTKAKVLALLIQLKQLGPIGDQIVKIISPEPEDQQQDPKLIQAELQKWEQLADQLGQKIQALEGEKASKVLDIESREKIAALQADVDKLRIVADLEKTNATIASTENQAHMDASMQLQQKMMELEARINEVAASGEQKLTEQAAAQEHETNLSQQQADAQAEQAAQSSQGQNQ